MQVVIGGNQLYGAKTGIGQYTQQLVHGLLEDSRVEELNLFVHGFIRDAGTASTERATSNLDPHHQHSALIRLRDRAAKSQALVRLYDTVLPMVARWNLRKFEAGAIFHAPDFILPPFKGVRIATILDLSTLKYPEFHPPARVSIVNRHIRKAAESADHILTISNFIKDEIIEELGVSPQKITTTYLGPGDGYRPISPKGFAKDCGNRLQLQHKSYFLSLATIEPRKNISRLLDAYEAYRDSLGSNALPLVIVGHPGWKSTNEHIRIRHLEQQNKLQYLGYLDQTTTNLLVGGARALLLPSLYEGFGLPVLEAMCAGTAVITSRKSAMSEVAQEAAILVDPCKTEEIVSAMIEATSDSNRIALLEQHGLKRSTGFTWADCIQKTLSVYETTGTP